MNELKASIAMFKRSVDYSTDHNPTVPPELFEATERVIQNKSTEILKTKGGFYVLSYSESGPWQEIDVKGDFLPIWIARINSWSSGGVRETEMDAYKHSQTGENVND